MNFHLFIRLMPSFAFILSILCTRAIAAPPVPPSLSSATISNSSPTSTPNFFLIYGTVIGNYTHYCIQENTTEVANCVWVSGILPPSYTVKRDSETDSFKNIRTLHIWIRDSAAKLTSAKVTTNSVTLDSKVKGVYLALPGNPGISVDSLIPKFGAVPPFAATPHYLDNRPDIDGVMVRFGWNQVKKDVPTGTFPPGTYSSYDWSDLETEINLIALSNKKVSLAIFAGDDMPDHIFQQYDVPYINFTEINHNCQAANLNTIKTPIVWHPRYQQAVRDMVISLSNFIKSKPMLDQTIVEVVVTGINRATGETEYP